MAIKLEIYYIKDLHLTNLNVKELKTIVYNISSSLRLNWGKEYIDFNFVTYSIDRDVTKTLQHLQNENVIIGLYPTGGSYQLLGRNISKNSIDIKIYNLVEFCELSKKATEFIVMNIQQENEYKLENSKYINFFHTTKIKKYIDYSHIITELEKVDIINTFPSENILRTDERRFVLNPISKKINPNISEYIGKTYEVDSLGTLFYSELSEEIYLLYSIYFKDVNIF
jgi:hypothetical protein